MRLWQDSEEEVEGVWFRSPAGAKFAPGPHPWASTRTWYNHEYVGPGQVGETERIAYYKGNPPAPYTGKEHCGSDEAIKHGGRHLSDPVIETNEIGAATCCKLPVVLCGHVIPATFTWLFESPAGCACCDGAFYSMVRAPDLDGEHTMVWRSAPLGNYNLLFGSCNGGTSITAHAELIFEWTTCIWRAELWQRKTAPFGGDSVVFCFPHPSPSDPLVLTADSMDSTVSWNQIFGIIQDSSDCQVRINNAAKRWKWTIAAAD